MNYYLAKTEPHEYSIDDLAKASEDSWDGVRNPVAVRALKAMKKGDRILIYHSGANPGIVGLAEVSMESIEDPTDAKSVIPIFKFVKKFEEPVSLLEIKQSHKFDDWALVKMGRLSTMEVPDNFIDYLHQKGLQF